VKAGFRETIWANLLFWLFLGLLLSLCWVSCYDPADDPALRYVLLDTFKFLILLFGFGFTAVSLFEWAMGYFAEKASQSKP
jgi:hypothetical protein